MDKEKGPIGVVIMKDNYYPPQTIPGAPLDKPELLERYLCLDHLIGHKSSRTEVRWFMFSLNLHKYRDVIAEKIKDAIAQMMLQNISELTVDTRQVPSQELCEAEELIRYNNDKIRAKVLGGKLIIMIEN